MNNIPGEWDNASESWTDFVRAGKDYFRDELNTLGMFRLIGSVKGKLVLDIACGEGYNTRMLARKGAETTGTDISEKLIDQAKVQEEKDQLGIKYYTLDVADLSTLPDKCFDLVTCFMAMIDIENIDMAIQEVKRVMKDDGRFIFSITHSLLWV